jgi:crotonobetainyl-CoA:carnitine CoA-transferase CaiB-like acyl-CoA transferase
MTPTASSPLSGINVLDFSSFIAGCYTAVMLGDLGANVIKVEPKHGDGARHWGPFLDGESRFFQAWNRNKRSIALDLISPEGRKIVHDLIARADVIVENFRPGITQKLGIDYDTAKGINPSAIYCSITGFGEVGPFGDRPAYDPILQCMSGTARMNERYAGKACISAVAMSDYGAGLLGSNAVLAALLHRERTGEGQRVSTSLLQAAMTMMSHFYIKAEDVEEKPPFGIFPYRLFETKDDLIFIAAPTDKFWSILCEAIGAPELAENPQYQSNANRVDHAEELGELLQPHFHQKTTQDWWDLLVEAGLPCGPVLTFDEFFDLPQVQAMEMRTPVQHTTLGPVHLPGVPVHLEKTPGTIQCAAPLLGEHSLEILEELGYAPESISELIESGILPEGKP